MLVPSIFGENLFDDFMDFPFDDDFFDFDDFPFFDDKADRKMERSCMAAEPGI